jgi:peptide-methionine (S)-S-oxide reductase
MSRDWTADSPWARASPLPARVSGHLWVRRFLDKVKPLSPIAHCGAQPAAYLCPIPTEEHRMFFLRKSAEMVSKSDALPGRADPIPTAETHFLSGLRLDSPIPDGFEEAVFGMGCFWGIERVFWRVPGVWLTMVGYGAGHTPNPTYQEVCTGRTGHNELVRVIYDPAQVSYDELLRVFWENHDPTQGMRQGNDVGTQYRSGIYTVSEAQAKAAEASKAAYQARLTEAGLGAITTEILPAGAFYMAEDYHQQYLAKNPGGYCGVAGTGVTCPVGLAL